MSIGPFGSSVDSLTFFVRHTSLELHQSTPHYPSSAILHTSMSSARTRLDVGERGEAPGAVGRPEIV